MKRCEYGDDDHGDDCEAVVDAVVDDKDAHDDGTDDECATWAMTMMITF